jgi:hypothetical protein
VLKTQDTSHGTSKDNEILEQSRYVDNGCRATVIGQLLKKTDDCV